MNLLETFTAVMEGNAARVNRISSLNQAIPLIETFLNEKTKDNLIAISPGLATNWPKPCPFEISIGTTDGNHKVCASQAWGAIADTGTLILLSGPENPTRLNFLADYHLVFVAAEKIVANKREVWQQLEAEGPLPRALNFISGPSRTADIEQTIQLGAHGPRSLWVFVVG